MATTTWSPGYGGDGQTTHNRRVPHYSGGRSAATMTSSLGHVIVMAVALFIAASLM